MIKFYKHIPKISQGLNEHMEKIHGVKNVFYTTSLSNENDCDVSALFIDEAEQLKTIFSDKLDNTDYTIESIKIDREDIRFRDESLSKLYEDANKLLCYSWYLMPLPITILGFPFIYFRFFLRSISDLFPFINPIVNTNYTVKFHLKFKVGISNKNRYN